MLKLLADKNLFPSTPNIFHAQLLNLRNSVLIEKLDARNLALLDALIEHPFWHTQSATMKNIHALLMTLPENTSIDVRIASIGFWRDHFENLYLTKDEYFYTLITRGVPFNTRTVFNPALMHSLFRGEVYLDLTHVQQIQMHESLQKALYLLAPVCDLRYNGSFPGLDLVFGNAPEEACRLAHAILPVQQAYSLISEAEFTPLQLEEFLEKGAEWLALHLDHKRHLLITLPKEKLQIWITNVKVTANNLISLYSLINEPIFQDYQQLVISKILKLLEDDTLTADLKQNKQIQRIAKQKITQIINEFNSNNSWTTITSKKYKELLYLWKIVDHKSDPEQPSVEEFLATIIFSNYADSLQINGAEITHLLEIIGGPTESKKCYTCLTWIIDTADRNKQKTLIEYVKNRFHNLDHSEILLTKGEEGVPATINPNYEQMYQELVKIYNPPTAAATPLQATAQEPSITELSIFQPTVEEDYSEEIQKANKIGNT